MDSPGTLLNRLTQSDTQYGLSIKPANWHIEDDLCDDMYDSMVQTWERDNQDTFKKPFDPDGWIDDFIILGFNSTALSAFESLLQSQYRLFGRELVEMILSKETVGYLASLMLWSDVMEHSKKVPSSETQGQRGQASGVATSSSITTKEKQQDHQRNEDLPKELKQDSADPSVNYPPWLTNLHLLALEKGIEVHFSNDDDFQSEQMFLEDPAEWSETTETPAYHGYNIPEESFLDDISSFISKGVQAMGTRRGYYSVARATYWSSSVQYARIWPIMKQHLRGWRRMQHIPPPSLLIMISEPAITALIRGSSGLSTVVIPQHEVAKAAEACNSYSTLLTSQQYLTACRNPRRFERVSHPDFPDIESSDIIIAPLPTHTIRNTQNSFLGNTINVHTLITPISILTAATSKAVDYMNEKVKKIVIIGWGDGVIGSTESLDFGTAGIRQGEKDYRISGVAE